MNRMKKGIAALLLVCLMLAAVTPYASAETIVASGRCTEDMRWTLNNFGTLRIIGSGVMPDYSEDSPAPWYDYRDSLTGAFFVDDTVTHLGSYAFYNCSKLTWFNFTTKEKVTIGEKAFSGCCLLKDIDNCTEKATSIGKYAFENCAALEAVTISADMETIEEGTFWGCTSLWSVSWGVHYYNPFRLTTIQDSAFRYCSALNGIYLPQELLSVGESAFAGCGLFSVHVLGKTAIGNNAFSGCYNLNKLYLEAGVPSIGERAFWGSALSYVEIPASVAFIGDGAFGNCQSLTGVWVNKDNANYFVDDDGVLYNIDKTELLLCPQKLSGTFNIPNSVTTIASGAFSGRTSLSGVVIPDGVKRLGAYTFSGCCSLNSIVFPADLQEIGAWAFAGCSGLRSIDLPDSVREIGDHAFCSCYDEKSDSGLESIRIPEGITNVHEATFNGCSALQDIYLPGTITEIEDMAFAFCSLRNGINLPENLQHIGEMVFISCEFEQIIIPNTVTTIDDSAFMFCSKLKTLSLPNNLTSIEDSAFSNCLSLTSLVIPASVRRISCSAFADCSNLTSVCFLGEAPEMDENAFEDWSLGKAAILYYLPGTSGWTTPTWNGYNTMTWDGKNIPTANTQTQFQDIPSGAYYANAVSWAVANNVTNGTSATTFSPEATCTRGQIVTFLWRAAGEPAPNGTVNPFTDVKSGAYYYNAVLWAVERGITSGTSKTTFSPDEGCTRGQVATFLWRYESMPGNTTRNPFTDVRTSAYYYGAVLWAVENGITNGTSATTFEPEATCTRGQIVTFLYRDIAN